MDKNCCNDSCNDSCNDDKIVNEFFIKITNYTKNKRSRIENDNDNSQSHLISHTSVSNDKSNNQTILKQQSKQQNVVGIKIPSNISEEKNDQQNVVGIMIPYSISEGDNCIGSELHKSEILKQQQVRLLLLKHASRCHNPNGTCPITPHCFGMQVLWKHIISCKDAKCSIKHCLSSRYILSHFAKCRDTNCQICEPVRNQNRKRHIDK